MVAKVQGQAAVENFELNEKTAEALREIVQKYRDKVKLPRPDNWKQMSDNDIWLVVTGQVAVVRGSEPADKMGEELRKRENWYKDLLRLAEEKYKEAIYKIFYEFNIQLRGKTIERCRKTKALCKNLAFLQSCGGPRAYIESIASIEDEQLRVERVIKDMAYIKNKGARDLLIELGLVQNAIAIDSRIKTLLNHLGENIPDKFLQSKKRFSALEKEMLEKVAKPCGITGAHLDRILYQNYDEIERELPGADAAKTNYCQKEKADIKGGENERA